MPVIEKSILVPQKVDDLWGLFMDLRRAAFKVRNVGADPRGTYVFLELDEDKDPSPVVEAWVGKPAPANSPLLKNIRTKELEKVQAEEKVRLEAELIAQQKKEEAIAKAKAEGKPEPETEGGPLPFTEPPKSRSELENIGFLKKIFRKFF